MDTNRRENWNALPHSQTLSSRDRRRRATRDLIGDAVKLGLTAATRRWESDLFAQTKPKVLVIPDLIRNPAMGRQMPTRLGPRLRGDDTCFNSADLNLVVSGQPQVGCPGTHWFHSEVGFDCRYAALGNGFVCTVQSKKNRCHPGLDPGPSHGQAEANTAGSPPARG
jgi:hypothetical protein